jgi:hypothetical protein
MTQSVIVKRYVFNAIAQTVTFPDYPKLQIEGIKLITNLDSSEIIYQFNSAAKAGTVEGNVLTLNYDTSGMSDVDKLAIVYDPPGGGVYDNLLSALTHILSPIIREFSGVVIQLTSGKKVQANLSSVDSTLGAVTSVGTLTTLTTCSTVTNVANLGLLPAENIARDLEEINYNTGIRSKII